MYVRALPDQNIHHCCSLGGSTENDSPLIHQGRLVHDAKLRIYLAYLRQLAETDWFHIDSHHKCLLVWG